VTDERAAETTLDGTPPAEGARADAAANGPAGADDPADAIGGVAADVDVGDDVGDDVDATTTATELGGAEPAADAYQGSLAPDELGRPDPRSQQELLAELGEAESRRDEYLDDLRRARAEFENFRKRTMREGGTQREAGRTDVVTSLLEVLDDLDRTLEAAEGSSDETLAKGVTLVADKLVRSLRAQGLERVAETGVAFDPNVHEAVQQRPSDEPREEPAVAEVLRPGYRLGERTLRPAMVVVEQ
jgi:molecular chaperone GrpE